MSNINYRLLAIIIFYILGILCAPVFTARRSAMAVFAAFAAAAAARIIYKNGIFPAEYLYKTTGGRSGILNGPETSGGIYTAVLLMAAVFLCAALRGSAETVYISSGINGVLSHGAFIKVIASAAGVENHDGGEFGKKYCTAALDIEKIYDAKSGGYKNICGRIILRREVEEGAETSAERDKQGLEENDLVEVSGIVKRMHKYKNPHLPLNYNPMQHEILYVLAAPAAGLKIIKKRRSFAAAVSNKVKGLFERHFPPGISGFLKAFALGDPSGFGENIYLDNDEAFEFAESGLLHVLVVSGGHVTLLSAFILSALSALNFDSRKASLGAFLFVTLYFLITGLQAAVTRAYISFAAAAACGALERNVNKYNIFIAALFLHMVLFPRFIFSAGFWLSYISTFAIIAACDYQIKIFKNPCLNAVMDYCKICLIAMAATYPLISYLCGYFPLNCLPANIFTLWIYELLLALCLVFIFFSFFSSWLAWGAASLIYHLSFAALKLNEWISSLPMGNLAAYKLGLFEMALIYLLLAVLALRFAGGAKFTPAGLTAAALIILAIFNIRGFAVKSMEGAEIIFLDVGQGDCALVKTSGRKWIIIDAGGSGSAYSKAIAPYLRYRHIDEIEYLIITHAHLDHYSAALKLYKNPKIKIKNLLYHQTGSEELEFKKLLRIASGVKSVSAGEKIYCDGAELEFLWPEIGSKEDANDSSLVAALRVNNRSALFCGDITQASEKKLVKKIASGRGFDFIKAPHHGSKYSSCAEFLSACGAGAAFISSGASNKFAHPHKEALRRYLNSGYELFNSQNCGGIILTPGRRIKITDFEMRSEYL